MKTNQFVLLTNFHAGVWFFSHRSSQFKWTDHFLHVLQHELSKGALKRAVSFRLCNKIEEPQVSYYLSAIMTFEQFTTKRLDNFAIYFFLTQCSPREEVFLEIRGGGVTHPCSPISNSWYRTRSCHFPYLFLDMVHVNRKPLSFFAYLYHLTLRWQIFLPPAFLRALLRRMAKAACRRHVCHTPAFCHHRLG